MATSVWSPRPVICTRTIRPIEQSDELRKILLISVAAAGIGVIAAVAMPSCSLVGEANAATNVNVSINIGTFYDRLDPYGDWIWYRGRYVWVPERIGPRWRPYTRRPLGLYPASWLVLGLR